MGNVLEIEERIKQSQIRKVIEVKKETIAQQTLDSKNSLNKTPQLKARQICKQKANQKNKRRSQNDPKIKKNDKTKHQSTPTTDTTPASKNSTSSNTNTAFKSWREEGLNKEERRHRKFGTAVKNNKSIIKSRQRKFSEITCHDTMKISNVDYQESKVDPSNSTFSFNFDV